MDSPSGIGLAMPRAKRVESGAETSFASPGRSGRGGALDAEGQLGRAVGSRRRLAVRVWIAVVHVLALVAPFYFSWHGLIACLALIFITGSVGVCMGYHRCLTHGSFQTYRPVRWLLAFLGRPVGRRLGADLGGQPSQAPCLQRQGRRSAFAARRQVVEPHAVVHAELRPALAQASGREVRARYYERQDDGGDPLSVPAVAPGDRAWSCSWSATLARRSAWAACGGAVAGVLGPGRADGVRAARDLDVNSATHMWGYRRYDTTDDSRNLWWVGLLAFGEGWHNNHHAYQRVASQGHRWWEIDVTYY